MDIKNLVKKLNSGHNGYLIIIILVGVLFMLIPSNSKDSKKEVTTKDEIYIDYEKDLEDILSTIDGVGKVKVMLTYSSSFEKSIAYEKNTDRNEKKDGDSIINESKSQNNVVMSDGKPFVIKEIYPEIKGVVVVSDGADDIIVKQNILDAVTTALAIAPHKVCVVKMS